MASSMTIDITFPDKDVKALMLGIERAQRELGKSNKEAIKWAAVTVATSLGASTKVSAKRRKVVKFTPKNRGSYAGPARLAAVGKDKNWNDKLLPIEDFGRVIFFKSKTTGQMLCKSLATGAVHSPEWFDRNEKKKVKEAAAIVQIKKSGLAKKTWVWLSSNARKAARNKQASVNWMLGENICKMSNFLPYVFKSFKTEGQQTVDTAMERASNSLFKKIEQKATDAFRKEGLA